MSGERSIEDEEVARLRGKLKQARAVIARLVDGGSPYGSEGQRVLDYFSADGFDPDFLPWPRALTDGIRPEDLTAANDD